jgi:iron complex transport system ATP-binding protein
VQVGDDGEQRDASTLSAREFARTVAMLSQSRPHPSGIEVRDVVAYGRHPHRGRFAGTSDADRAAISRALAFTGLTAMADRAVDQLSGGELQRVWLATALAQDTGILLLDEPTNHLDLRYQIETLDLVRDLADEHGTAVGVVLHDLDHAASVADEVVLLHRGRVHAAGHPHDVLTGENLSHVYGLRIDTSIDEETGRVHVAPHGRHHDRARRPTPVAAR